MTRTQTACLIAVLYSSLTVAGQEIEIATTLSFTEGPTVDRAGNVYFRDNQLRGTSETLDTKTGVHVISPEGKLITFIPIPEDFITNNTFGGPDMKTLYVTAGKTLYKLRTDVAGLPR